MSATIIAISEALFPEWLAMRQRLYRDVSDEFHWQDMRSIFSARDRAAFFLCNAEGAVMGLLELALRNYVDGCLTSPVAYIEGIYLSPAFRKQGHGSHLLRYAEQWGREHGCSELATDALLDDEQAQAFHRHQGFVEVDRIVEYKKSL